MAGLELEEYMVSLADNNVTKSFIIVICILFPCSVSYPAPKNPNLSKPVLAGPSFLREPPICTMTLNYYFCLQGFPGCLMRSICQCTIEMTESLREFSMTLSLCSFNCKLAASSSCCWILILSIALSSPPFSFDTGKQVPIPKLQICLSQWVTYVLDLGVQQSSSPLV